MADVKVPPLLHKRSITAQKAWYKKHGMEMPQERSAAGAKKIKPVEVKPVEVPVVDKPKTAREISMERQKAYYAKGGRQPIGAGGSGGSSAMAGGGQSTIKDLKASIKAGFNPKVSLDPYESERAKKTGPRSLKMKKEEVQIGEALSPERKRMFDLKLKLIKKVANKKAYTKSSKVDSPHASLNPAADMKLNPRPPSGSGKEYYREEAQIDEVTKKEAESTLGGPVKEKPKMPPGKQPAAYRYVRGLARKAMKAGMKKEEVTLDEVTGYEGVKDRTDMIKRAAAMGRMGKNVFLARVKARAAEMRKQKAMKEEVQDQADVGEYDYEGDMAKSQLRSILANAKRMHDMLEENTNLPEWVQSKITLAEDYILTAANYMEGEMNEELIRQEESIFEAMKKMEMDDEEDEMDDEDEMEDDEEEEETKMKAKRTNESAKDWKKAFSNVAQKNLQKDVGKIRSKVGRLNYIGMQPKVDTTPKVTATMTKKGTYSEEVGGKVAVTPKEKALAAHHGDKTKITYGDVIKARLKSVAAKAMNKGK